MMFLQRLPLGERLNQAISLNNLCVIELRQGQFQAALQAATQAVQLIEKDLLSEIN